MKKETHANAHFIMLFPKLRTKVKGALHIFLLKQDGKEQMRDVKFPKHVFSFYHKWKSFFFSPLGDSLGVVIVYPSWVRAEQRSMPSTAWLMPSPRYWAKDEVLVITDKRNYTVADYKDLFADLDYMDGYYMRQDVENLIMGEC